MIRHGSHEERGRTMTGTWTAPALDQIYICYDEDDVPVRMARYVDMLADIETEFWPRNNDAYELLLWAYNAEPVSGS